MKKEKIKNIISEVRVGILSFIKNNKYLSLGIALFAIIGIVAGFVVFAANDTVTATVDSLSLSASDALSNSGTEDKPFESFSDVTFVLDYELSNDSGLDADVTIVAEIPEQIDAYWIDTTDIGSGKMNFSDFEYETTSENKINNRKVTITIPANDVNNSSSESGNKIHNKPEITLRLGNINGPTDNLATITPTFNIFAGEESKTVSNSYKVFGNPTFMNVYLIPGYSYKASLNDDGFNGRYMPFGFVLGYPKKDLHGCYFDSSQTLNIHSSSKSLKSGNYNLNDSGYEFIKDKTNVMTSAEENRFSRNIIPVLDTSGELDISENNFSKGSISNMTINGINAKIDNPSMLVDYDNGDVQESVEIVAFGSYYSTIKAERTDSDTNDVDVNVFAEADSSKSYITMVNKNINYGTNKLSVKLEGDDVVTNNEKTSATLAFGEEVGVVAEYSYGSDADENSALEIKVAIPSSQLELIEYSSEIDGQVVAVPNILIEKNGNVLENAVIEYGIINSEGNYEKTSSYNDIKQDKKNHICEIIYTIKGVTPGDTIRITSKVKSNATNLDEKSKNVTILASANLVCTDTSENCSFGNDSSKPSEASLTLTPFKARTSISYNDNEQEGEVDISNKTINVNGYSISKSTLSIYPSIIAPGAFLESNALGINKLGVLLVVVQLPEKVNYVKNSSYKQPLNSIIAAMYSALTGNISSSPNKTLYYVIENKEIGSYFEPIKLDINYDVDTPSEGLPVKVSIIAMSGTVFQHGIEDLSTLEERTTTGTINYIAYNSNDVPVSKSIISSKNTIKTNSNFTITSSLYNGSDSESYDDIDLLVELPEEGFSGDINLSDISDGATCSNQNYSSINMVSLEPDEWGDCTGDSFNLIKFHIDSIQKGEKVSKLFKVNTSENIAGDLYNFKLYIFGINNEIIKGGSTVVEVDSTTISGYVWEDFNKDGIMSEDENKIEGIILRLYDKETGEQIGSDVTSNKSGYYEFKIDSEEGTYYVVPEFNADKYGLSPHHGETMDIRYRSSFKIYSEDNEVEEPEEGPDEDLEENMDEDDDEESNDEFEDNSSEDLDDEESDENSEDEEDKKINISSQSIKSDEIPITPDNKKISNINLGLTLKEIFTVKLDKYVTSAITTNSLGISNTTNYGNVKLAKLDVKNINSLNIKVIYTIKVKNTGYYPGYIRKITDVIPDGMQFNENYAENRGWEKVSGSDSIIEYTGLKDQKLDEKDEKYITVAFDLVNKNAGSYINYASIDDDDLNLYQKVATEDEGSDD